MKRISPLRRVFAAVILGGALLSAVPARADETVKFDPFPKGLAAKLVEEAWRKEKDYQEYVGVFDMVPDYMLGLADVNADGTPEIFARHSDDELGFCDPKGVCRMHIYAYTDKGVFEIGRMMAGDPVVVSSIRKDKINNIIVIDSETTKKTYVWDGKAYKPQ